MEGDQIPSKLPSLGYISHLLQEYFYKKVVAVCMETM